jgi:hypothetical protein
VGAHTKFGIAWKNVGVRVRALNLELCGVNTHNKVSAVCTHIIMAWVVCAILAEHRGVWLVHAQCGYMLSHNNLVNGVRRVLVRSGGVIKFGMV